MITYCSDTQWNLSKRTFPELKGHHIKYLSTMDKTKPPNYPSLSILRDLNLLKTTYIGPKVSVAQRFHCIYKIEMFSEDTKIFVMKLFLFFSRKCIIVHALNCNTEERDDNNLARDKKKSKRQTSKQILTEMAMIIR